MQLVQRAEELGYDSVWTAEAYGSDAVTPLAYLAALTKRIKLGTGIMQLAARTPANAAMCAGTVDALAGGGRFIAGLGVSGPQIVEGWYGEPWGRPYYRYKDYVAIMRKIFRREEPVTHDGREISLPYTGEGAAGVGKPLKSILHMNPDIPIYLGTGNESTVKLTAEIADGWLPLGFVPGSHGGIPARGWRKASGAPATARACGLRDPGLGACRGRRRREGRAGEAEARGRAVCRRHGSPRQEFPQGHDDPARLRDAADRIQELYLAHRKEEAIAAVPDEWVDMKSLVGPPERIKQRFRAWEDSGATSLTVRSRQPEAIEVMAQAARLN